MKLYETVLIVLFFLLTAFFLWMGVKEYRQAGANSNKKLRAAARKKALLWMTPGLMFFLSALYVIFRAGWLFAIVALIGTMGFGFSIGSGLGENMREH